MENRRRAENREGTEVKEGAGNIKEVIKIGGGANGNVDFVLLILFSLLTTSTAACFFLFFMENNNLSIEPQYACMITCSLSQL